MTLQVNRGRVTLEIERAPATTSMADVNPPEPRSIIMELRTKIDIMDLDGKHVGKILRALDDVVDDIGDVTIGAVADLMARVTAGLDEQRACA